jgi:hypothetical protein
VITLHDPETGRTAQLSPPDPSRIKLDPVALADLARRWSNLVTHDQAQAELRRLLKDDRGSVLHGLAWILSAWAVLAEARTGMPADEAIRTLDYQGPWRRANTAEEAEMWATLTAIVRQGALAQLTGGEEAVAAFERNALQHPEMPGVVLQHMLVLIDGLQQDMQRNGLPTWEVAAWVSRPPGDV